MMLSTSSASARMLARRTPCAGELRSKAQALAVPVLRLRKECCHGCAGRMACGSLAGARPTAAVGRRSTVAVVAAFTSTNPALTMGRVQVGRQDRQQGHRGVSCQLSIVSLSSELEAAVQHK